MHKLSFANAITFRPFSVIVPPKHIPLWLPGSQRRPITSEPRAPANERVTRLDELLATTTDLSDIGFALIDGLVERGHPHLVSTGIRELSSGDCKQAHHHSLQRKLFLT